jgi:hypothetical protein
MNYFQDIANLISIRTFLVTSIDNLHMKLSRDDIKNIQTRIQYLDRTILEHTLKMDLSKIGHDSSPNRMAREIRVESTEDTKDVLLKHQAAEHENSSSIKSNE